MTKRRVAIVLTALLIAGCYGKTLMGMYGQWMNDEDMGHGLAVPAVIAFYLWRERERWMAVTPRPSWWGLVLLGGGAALQAASVAGAGLFAGALGFVVTVTGAVLSLGGFPFLRAWAFPLFLAVFMLPKLAVVYNQSTLPLQLLASKMAAGILTTAGLAVIREGNILEVGGHRVLVAEACNGIRYLLSLGFTGLVLSYVAESRGWVRGAVMAAAVPVAIVANAVRVAASAGFPALDAGTPHFVFGWVLFVVCLGALTLARRVFERFDRRRHV